MRATRLMSMSDISKTSYLKLSANASRQLVKNSSLEYSRVFSRYTYTGFHTGFFVVGGGGGGGVT